ncbi:alpha/beta fold hydrolase [Streptomyces sp. HUAS MG47]|uniref:thioesterase II family protein n=1 Tax=Streptomyces solicamelliae TaxID=3231716 RepID=UPI003877AE10
MVSTDWLRVFHAPETPAARLVCLPYAGGSAAAFRLMTRDLPPEAAADVEVVSVQYPGRQDRCGEPPLTTIEALAEAVVRELAAHASDDLPVVLLGHSMGALVAYEAARRRAPAALVVSGCRAPSVPRLPRHEPLDDDAILALVRRLDGPGTSALDHPDVLRDALPSLRADFDAVRTYTHRPTPRLACPVTALTGTKDPHVTERDAAAWREETTARFTPVSLDGGHFLPHENPGEYATEVGKALTAALTVRPATPPPPATTRPWL